MEQGLILTLQFTAFDIESHFTCNYDHLTITDGDGTTLMEKSCGSANWNNIVIGGENIESSLSGYGYGGYGQNIGSLPPNITSTSNIVKLVFSTDNWNTRSGWSISWMAVTPGECQQYVWIFDDLSNFFQSLIVDDLTISYFLDTSLPSFLFHFSFIFPPTLH